MANGRRIDFTVGFNVDKSGLTDIRKQLKDISQLSYSAIKQANPGMTMKEAEQAALKVREAIGEINPALNAAFNTKTGVLNLEKLSSSLKKLNLQEIQTRFNAIGPQGQQAFLNISKAALTANVQLKQTSSIIDKMGTTLMNTLKWTVSSSLINRFTGAFQQAYGYVQHLDTSLNDIRIVTGKSADEMARFGEQANEAAKDLGKATTDYTEASLIYYQQGLADDEVRARTETTLKAANVTGQSTSEVSEQLTAVWNGYRISAENTEVAVDKLAAVAATTAADLEELSTGMSKVAAAANSMGVDMDQLNATIATIESVTRQAPESVGTALKTIYARMGDLKVGEADEDGTKLGEVSSTLQKVGIEILDVNGDLRDMGTVMEEIGEKWDTWSKAEQQAIAIAVAGKRQYNNLFALFDNWDMYTKALETSRNSIGTLQKQQDIYMESTAAHIQQLKTQSEDLYDSLLNTQDINNMVDGLTKILGLITNILDGLGSGKTLLTGITALVTTGFSKQIAEMFTPMIMNAQNKQYNQEALNTLQRNIDLQLQQKTISNEAADAMAQKNKQMSQYWDLMSEGEINASQETIREIGNITTEIEVLKERRAEFEKWMQQQGQGNVVANDSYLTTGSDNQEAALNIIRNEEEAVIDLTEKYNILFDDIHKFNAEGLSEEERIQQLEEIENKILEIVDILEGFKNQDIISDEEYTKDLEQLDKIHEKLDQLKDEKNDINNGGVFGNTSIHLNTVGTSIDNISKKYEGFKEVVTETSGKVEENNQKLNEAEASLRINELQTEKTVQAYSQLLGATTTLAFGLQSLSNVGNVISNENLTSWQKFIQLTTSLGFSIGSLVRGFQGLSKSIPEIATHLSGVYAKLNYQMLSGTKAIDERLIAETVLGRMNEKDVALTTERILGKSKLLKQLTNEEKALISHTLVMEKDTVATQMATKTKARFGDVVKGVTKLLKADPTVAIFTAIATAVAIATVTIKAHDKAVRNAAQHQLDYAQAEEKAAKAQADTSKTELENVKQLIDAYKELRGEYTQPEQIDALRRRVYELSQEYNVHIDMIQLMTANYEELDRMMNQLLFDASNQASVDSLEAINREIDALIAEMKNIQADNSHPLLEFFMNCQTLTQRILENVREIIQDLTGVEIPDWLVGFAKRPFNIGYATTEYNQSALAQGGESVQGVISINKNNGTLEFDEDTFATYTDEQRKEVQDWLAKYYSENEELGSEFVKFFDHSAENIEKAINQTVDKQQEIETDTKNYNNQEAENIFTQLYGDKDIGNAYEYNEAKKAIADTLVEDLNITEKEAYELAEKTLESKASYDVREAGAIADLFTNSTEQDKAKITEQYNNLSTGGKHFITQNEDVLPIFPDIESFEEQFHDFIEAENNHDNTINVQIALQNSKKGEFKPEDITALFASETFDIGKTQDEFENQTYQQQLADLLNYYIQANQLENDFQNTKLSNLNKLQEEQGNKLQEELTTFQEKVDEILEAHQVSDEVLSQDFQNWIVKELAVNDEDIELLNKYSEGVVDLTDAEKERVQVLEKENADAANKLEAYKEYNILVNNSGDAIRNVNKQSHNYIKTVESITGAITKLKDGLASSLEDGDWESIKKGIEELKKGTDSSIDSLQSAYSSLTSIMEEYNSTQTLSMDNLQTFLNMDTAYLSALQIENGQMVLNEEALKQIALARLDEAEAEAYAQAMEELHNEETRRGIEGEQQAAITLDNLGQHATAAAEAARSGAEAWHQYWNEALNREGIQNDAYAQQVGDALNNKLQMIGKVREQITSGGSLGFKNTMKGPSSEKASSASKKEAEHVDNLERETDLYRKINMELDDIEKTLGRIQKIESHEWGIDYQKSLEEENDLLDKQLDKLKQKKAIQEQDLSIRRKQLEDIGVSFNAEGSVMNNAEETLNSLYANYNAMAAKYNAMSAEQQEGFKATLETEKDRIEKIEKKMSEYESTFSDYQSTLDSLLEVHYAEIENEVKKFNNMVEVHLELSEAEREWNDFWYDVVQDVDDDDFAKQIEKSFGKLDSLILGTDNDVSVLTGHLNDTVTEVEALIASANRGGEDSLFGDDTAAAKENLEDYRDKLMKALTEAKEEVDNISENYIKMLEHAQDLIDDQVDGWESIGDHLEHNMELIKLVSGDKAFDALNKQYEKQYQNNLNLINAQKQSQDFWAGEIERYKQLLEVTDKNTVQWKTYSEALEKASENYKKAVEDLDKTIEEALKNLEEWRKNQSDAIMDAIDKAMSGGLGLDLVEQEWKLINDQADKYLDNVQRAYSMEEYANELDKAANATGLSATNQAKLNAFREQELAQLREKDKLTKYDIEESRARLAILQQQLALEDAQRNKSNMRLRRDSQGNYTYQYTADEGAVDEAEGGLLTAKKEWYELVKARRKETNDWIIEAEKNLASILAQIDEAEKAGDIERLNKYKDMELLARQEVQDAYKEAGVNIQDIYDGVALYFANVNNGAILPENAATVSQLIIDWAGEGEESFLGAVKKALVEITNLQQDFGDKTRDILKEAGVNYINLKEKGIDPVDESLEDLQMDNEDLAIALEDVNDELTTQEGNLRQVEAAYYALQSAAVSAIQSANAALVALAQTAVQTQMQVAAAIAAARNATAITGSYYNNNKGGNTGGDKGGNSPFRNYIGNNDNDDSKNKNNGLRLRTQGGFDTVTVPTGLIDIYQYNANQHAPAGGQLNIRNLGTNGLTFEKQKPEKGVVVKNETIYDYLKRMGMAYATGGYTGAWPGSDGKLAVLHQKELVLNESDTKNILGAVEAIRTLDFNGVAKSLVQSANIQAQVLASVGESVLQALNVNQGDSVSNYRNVTVNADFSGVRSADAIYQALMELENTGMQTSFAN